MTNKLDTGGPVHVKTIRSLIKELSRLEKILGPRTVVSIDTKVYKNWRKEHRYDRISTVETNSDIVVLDDSGSIPDSYMSKTWVVLNGE